MSYEVLVDTGDNNKILGISKSFPAFESPQGNVYKLTTSYSGSIDRKSLRAVNVNTGAGTCDLEPNNQLAVTLTDLSDQALPDTSPIDGIPEIAKDTGQCKIKIQKKDGSGNDLTGAEDNDAVEIWADRAGGLSAFTVNLANGFAEVTLSAGSLLALVDISVTDPSGKMRGATARLQVK